MADQTRHIDWEMCPDPTTYPPLILFSFKKKMVPAISTTLISNRFN